MVKENGETHTTVESTLLGIEPNIDNITHPQRMKNSDLANYLIYFIVC